MNRETSSQSPFHNQGHQHYSSNGFNLKVCYHYGLDAKDIEILADVLEFISRSDDGWIAITNIIRRHPGLKLQGAGRAPLAWRTVEDQTQKRFKYYEKIGLLRKTANQAGVNIKKNRYSVNHDLEALLRTCRELTPEEEAKLPKLKGAMAEPYITAKQRRKKGTSRNVSNPDIIKDTSQSVSQERARQMADKGHVLEREEGPSQNGLTHTASRIQRDAKSNILLPEALRASGKDISAKGAMTDHILSNPFNGEFSSIPFADVDPIMGVAFPAGEAAGLDAGAHRDENTTRGIEPTKKIDHTGEAELSYLPETIKTSSGLECEDLSMCIYKSTRPNPSNIHPGLPCPPAFSPGELSAVPMSWLVTEFLENLGMKAKYHERQTLEENLTEITARYTPQYGFEVVVVPKDEKEAILESSKTISRLVEQYNPHDVTMTMVSIDFNSCLCEKPLREYEFTTPDKAELVATLRMARLNEDSTQAINRGAYW